MQRALRITLPLLLALPAAAQTVTNSGFDAGLSAWAVAPTSTSAVGAPGNVEFVDMDGAGPLLPGPAASFATGKLPGTGGTSNQGVTVRQDVQLRAGVTYTFRMDWSTTNAGPATSNGGRYRLFLLGEVLETVNVGGVPAFGQVSGVLEDTFTADADGPATIEIRVDSTITTPDPPVVFQRIDNVRLESGFNSFPGFLPLSGGGIETFVLDPGPQYGGDAYLVLGSLSGELPGLDLPGDVHIPLALDAYTQVALDGLGGSTFGGFSGVLDAAGSATTSFQLPPGLPPSAAGLTLTHAFVVIDSSGIAFGSNADSILLF